jgi:hypothetical protein
MKIKLLLSMLAIFFASQVFANEVTGCVAVSADGYKTSYVLANIQRIEINATDTEASMTILNKDGVYSSEYQKILFAESNTGIEELGISSFFVFPNPVSNTLYIQGVDEYAALEVYNLTGKSLIKEKGTELDVTSLNQGTYILRINNQYVKFIKK